MKEGKWRNSDVEEIEENAEEFGWNWTGLNWESDDGSRRTEHEEESLGEERRW
jgi:hypothetical protein